MLLIEKDANGALDYCKGAISDLLQNRIDLSLLVITKGLGKKTNAPPESSKEGEPSKPATSGGNYHAK